MLNDPWHFLAIAILLLALLHVGCKLVFAAYFRAKEHFVDRIHSKMKGSGDGKE